MSKTVPDFANVTFLPIGERAKLDPDQKTDLFKFFNAVINQEKMEMDEIQLQQIFCQDLTINTKKLDKRLVCVLGEALVYYMTVWPGWQRCNEYLNGHLSRADWYERFRQYLIFKSNFIIKNAGQFAVGTVSETATSTKVQNTDISEKVVKMGDERKVAPYVLCVGGPPSVLNNVVFMETNGNILIKQHMEKPWRDLTLKEFFNWVHVSVEVNLPDISVIRNNAHKYERYIALSGDLTQSSEPGHINYITKTTANADLQPYSFEYFYYYFQQLFNVLKEIPGINKHRLQELDALLTEFLADIKEVNVYNCTMCTDISIAYHIGKSKYIRNKKMVSSDPKKKRTECSTINFYEILIPQIVFTLKNFKAEQEMEGTDISFKSLNKILKLINTDCNHADVENLKKIVNDTCLIYKCTLCSETFADSYGYSKLVDHFAKNHKDEQALLCFRCRKEFQVRFLAGQRWKHACLAEQTKNS